MPVDVGSQTVSILYHTAANSSNLNLRQASINRVGIYEGGWLSIVDGTHAQVSALTCEISDGTYNVRVKSAAAVSVVVGSVTPYVVLRWVYTGSSTNDYMEFKAVSTPSANDLVVGKCTFAGGGALNGFTYESRSNPSTKEMFLRVEPTGDSDLRVRVRGGYIQNGSASIHVDDQKSNLFTPPTSNSKVYLVYIDPDDGTVNVDSTGTAAASPVAPDYAGKLVIAEVTLAAGATTIPSSCIKDVRPFVTPASREVDDSTIEVDSSGKLKVVNPTYIVLRDVTTQVVGQASWTKVTFATTVKSSGISVANSVITLPAGKLYCISYTVTLNNNLNTAYGPYGNVRLRVVSGDVTWEFKDDDNNVSIQQYKNAVYGTDGQIDIRMLSGTYLILPASVTTIQLEALTRDGVTNYRGQVIGASLNIFSR